MDGTIIDSTDAIVKYWRQLGKEIGVDGDSESDRWSCGRHKLTEPVILETSHGRRSVDVLAIYAPHLANFDCKFDTGDERLLIFN